MIKMKCRTAMVLCLSMILSCLCFQSCDFFKKENKMDHLVGIVRDDAGNPLQGVTVESDGVRVETDQNGMFTLEYVGQTEDNRYVLNFSHKGYFSVTRSADVESAAQVEVMLQPVSKEGVSNSTTFSAQKGSKVKVGSMTVNIPADGLVSEDGETYKGKVNFKMLYLDPKRADFSASMPGGDLVAKDTAGEELALVSYGMVDVVMTDDNGKKLQLKDGTKSELTFPIPAGMAEKAPEKMPLWSFDEKAGVWVVSGSATRQGDIYVGEVGHFSWVNLDDPKQFVVLKGKVEDEAGNALPGICITVEQVTCFSQSDGSYSVRIPGETAVNISVKSADYLNYSPEVNIKVEGQPGGSKYSQDIVLPTMPIVKGRVHNTSSDACPFSLYCQYEKDGKKQSSGLTLCKKTGDFMLRVPADAKNVSLHICSPDGQDQAQPVNFEGKDIDLGELTASYIELVKREQPILSVGGKNSNIDLTDCDFVVFDDSARVAVGLGGDLVLKIQNYTEKPGTYDAEVVLSDEGYHSSSAQVVKMRVGNRVQLKITSVGKVKKDSTSAGEDGRFDAVVYVPMMYKGACNNFDELCWPDCMPKMRTPISYVNENYVFGMPAVHLVYSSMNKTDLSVLEKVVACKEPFSLILCYQKCSDAEAAQIEETLEKLGFKKDSDDDFIKDDIVISMEQGDLQLKDCGSDQKVQLTLDVKTGLMVWVKSLIKKFLGLSF